MWDRFVMVKYLSSAKPDVNYDTLVMDICGKKSTSGNQLSSSGS